MNNRWQHFRFSYNRRPIIFRGINLWAYPWKAVGISTEILGPGRDVTLEASIYEIRVKGTSHFFAAVEILPDYWLFAAKDDPFDFTGNPAETEPEPPHRSTNEPIPQCLQSYF
jgi:hypothetical protein